MMSFLRRILEFSFARILPRSLAGRAFAVGLTLSIPCAPGANADGDAIDFSNWRTYGYTNEIRRLLMVDGNIWALSSGGILQISPTDYSVTALTNTDGLYTNDWEYGLVDDSGTLWLAGYGWLLRRASGEAEFTPFAFLDQQSQPLRLLSLADDGNRLWVGVEGGLYLFSKTIDGGQIMDVYSRFGALPDGVNVNSVALTTDSIWLATSAGLAAARRTDPLQLKSFANWRSFTNADYPELPGAAIHAVAALNDSIYIGTDNGAFLLSRSGIDTSFTSLGLFNFSLVNSMSVSADTLHLFTTRAEYIRTAGVTTQLSFAGLPNTVLLSGVSVAGVRVVGTPRHGAYRWDGTAFTRLLSGSIPGENVRDIVAFPDGSALGAFWNGGFGRFVDGAWTALGAPYSFAAYSCSRDSGSADWLGTYGIGAWRYLGSDSVRYDSTNSSLQGNSDGGPNNYVVVPDIASDGRYSYFANYRAVYGEPVSIVDQSDPTRWASFGAARGIDNSFIVSIAVSGSSLAVGSEQTGLYLCVLPADPFNTAAISVTHYYENAPDPRFRLRSDNVNAVRFDRNAVLWVAHRFGLARYDAGIERFVDIVLPLALGPETRDVAFDMRGNVWVGCSNGLGRLNPAENQFSVFTTFNSGLVSDFVNSLSYDIARDYLWIGSDHGLSVYHPDVGQPIFAADEVTAFPNPFLITTGAERLNFNFSEIADLDIFTEHGERVWRGRTIDTWDGRNQAGREVSSGVYLFVVRSGEGAVGRGKILLIRNH